MLPVLGWDPQEDEGGYRDYLRLHVLGHRNPPSTPIIVTPAPIGSSLRAPLGCRCAGLDWW